MSNYDNVLLEQYVNVYNNINSKYEEKYGKHFSSDGIFNPRVYFTFERPKVMMLLKENKNSGEWNPVDDVNNEYKLYHSKDNNSHCWAPNIIRTVQYIVNEGEWWINVPIIKDEAQIKSSDKYVTGFAYFNIKKLDEGIKISDDKNLTCNAKNDRDLICPLFKACIPDVVFCCCKKNKNKVHSPLASLLKELLNPKVCEDANNYQIICYRNGDVVMKSVLVDWFHPSRNGFTKKEMYNHLSVIRPKVIEVMKENSSHLSKID